MEVGSWVCSWTQYLLKSFNPDHIIQLAICDVFNPCGYVIRKHISVIKPAGCCTQCIFSYLAGFNHSSSNNGEHAVWVSSISEEKTSNLIYSFWMFFRFFYKRNTCYKATIPLHRVLHTASLPRIDPLRTIINRKHVKKLLFFFCPVLILH